MNLKNFEIEVGQKIVKRDLDYFKNGNIRKLEKVSENEFSSIIFGTKKYSIFIKLNGETIVEHECDCHYGYGNVRKHKVAVF